MKSVLLLSLSLTVKILLAQTPVDSTYKQGRLFLQKNLSAELSLIEKHVEPGQKRSAHALWAKYLDRPHPSVATLEKYFSDAAAEFNVPSDLLKAIGQVENNWTQIGPSIDQGWGIMHLVDNSYCHTLQEAAQLLHVSKQTLKDNPRQNIRGAAALLRKYFLRKEEGKLRLRNVNETSVEEWFGAAKLFSGLINEELRTVQARRYFSVIIDGNKSSTLWGEIIELPRHKDVLLPFSENFEQHNSDSRSSDYGPAVSSFTSCNFTSSRNHSIDTYVNHWIGTGTAAGAVSWFQNCNAQASAHFVVNNSGTIYQVVPVANTAWHCGASGYPYNNGRSIGVEHEATVANPGLWTSTAMLQASAQMSCHFCGVYSIPTNQNITSPGICGHNSMPGTNTDCPGTIPWSSWFSYFNAGNCSAPAPVQPANDYCGNAAPLTVYGNTCGAVTVGDINGATQSTSATLCDGFTSSNANDVWYTFVATSSSHNITVTPSGGMDAVVELRTGCPGSSIDCADNGGGEGSTEILNATGLIAGTTYYVRVYDYTGSGIAPTTTTFSICITTPCSNPVKPVIAGTNTICSGQNSTLTITNPCSGCNFTWSNGASGLQTTISTAGTFFVSASNACGAIASDPFTFVVNPTPQPAIGNLSNAYCLASANATLSLSPSGGLLTGTGISGNVFSPSIAGVGTHTITYSVLQNGCSASVTQNTMVSTNPNVQISTSDSSSFCQGNSITLTATQGTAYAWSTGATTQSITVSYEATFNVTVTNPGGCNANVSAVQPINTSFFLNPIVNAGIDTTLTLNSGDSIVIGASPTAAGGAAPYSFNWSPILGISSSTVSNPVVSNLNTTTNYIVTVTDANGCTASDQVLVNVVAPCTYLTPVNNFYFQPAASLDSFYVDAETNCGPWNAITCNWIQLLSPAFPHTGDAMVVFSVLQNMDTASRSCTIDITGGDYVNIFQEGVVDDPCSPPPAMPAIQQNFCDLATALLPNTSYQWFLNGIPLPNANTRFHAVNQSGYYTVQIADSNFCSAISTDKYVAYPACLGSDVNETNGSTILVYPTHDFLEIMVSENLLGSEVSLINALSQVVFHGRIQALKSRIDTTIFASGIYLLTIKDKDGKVLTKKIWQ